jgi:ribonuclease P protein component
MPRLLPLPHGICPRRHRAGALCLKELRHETHLSAEQADSQASPWLPVSHGHGRRSKGYCQPPPFGPQAPLGLTGSGALVTPAGSGLRPGRLPNRRDFLRVQDGQRCAKTGFVLQAAPVPADFGPAAARVGYTVSRKVGNAVERNRVRRRLREVAQQVIPGQARADFDYVLVGRRAALKCDFAALREDLIAALKRLRAFKAATP